MRVAADVIGMVSLYAQGPYRYSVACPRSVCIGIQCTYTDICEASGISDLCQIGNLPIFQADTWPVIPLDSKLCGQSYFSIDLRPEMRLDG